MDTIPNGRYPIKDIRQVNACKYIIVLKNDLHIAITTLSEIRFFSQHKKIRKETKVFIVKDNICRIRLRHIRYKVVKYRILLSKGDFLEELI